MPKGESQTGSVRAVRAGGKTGMMTIKETMVIKRFGSFVALDRVDLEVRSGELLALLGPSGSGKATLLRILGGLDRADGGHLNFFGEEALGLPPRERQVGFVFQHYSLFRHMTVFHNVAFGLEVRPRSERLPRAKIRERVHNLLHLVQLEPFADRYPGQLSGGQRQRVALALVLAIEPKGVVADHLHGLVGHVRDDQSRKTDPDLDQGLVLGVVDLAEDAALLAFFLVVLRIGLVFAFALPLEVLHEASHYEALLPRVARKRCTAAVNAARFCGGGVVAMT